MRVVGIIAEFDPFHNGHEYIIRKAKELTGDPRAKAVIVMSGPFVQRGNFSVLPKHTRAHQALKGGADLILELPFTFACAPSERFAHGAVQALLKTGIVTDLAFGIDTEDPALIEELAFIEPSDEVIRSCLSEGMSYPAARAKVIPLGPKPDPSRDRARRGEMLYNDGSMCFQQWQSCASCHPDGRVDGLNWDLLNDGMGNPKQTRSELYNHVTPPTMITGIRKDMHACNAAGLIHIQFVTRPEEDVYCFDAYVAKMKPVPSPYLVNGKLSARAQRGEKLFRQAKCADCHTPDKKAPGGEPLWTDLKLYDVGVGTATETGRKFDTPTLAECWRTAPYLYDGRALTMEEVLTICNPNDKHGETSKLTPEQIKDLAE